MAEALQAIKAVAQRTGLTAHVIRVWEKRYEAVTPERTGTNRRLYSEEQVERLRLLRDVTHAGYNIGQVAKLPTEKLRELAVEARGESGRGGEKQSITNSYPSLLERCSAAVKALDTHALEDALKQGATELGSQGVLQRLIAPLAQRIGEWWCEGTLTAAHEHFASAVIRVFLGHAATSFTGDAQGPGLVVGTPTGQLHELGALLVGAAAANLGWRVTYLGASLPAAEIAGAARQNRARAVALSLVYPEDDPRLESELNRLRELLPVGTALLVGGRAMPAYHAALKRIGAFQMKDLAQLSATLENLRSQTRPE